MFIVGLILLATLISLATTGTISASDPVTITLGIVTAWCLFAPIRGWLYKD